MLDIVNAAVSANTVNTRKPDGQNPSHQANARLEPQLRQPQTPPPQTPVQTQQALSGNSNANSTALLNNREQAALNALRQQPIERPQRRIEDQDTARRASASINTEGRPATPAQAQALATAATVAITNVASQQSITQAPPQEEVNPADVPVLQDAVLPDFNKLIGLRASLPNTQQVENPALQKLLVDLEA